MAVELDDRAFLLELEKALKKVQKQAGRGLDELGQRVAESARSRAPVDTGYLKSSISSQRRGDVVDVLVRAPYAAYVEFGTEDEAPEPYLRPALREAKAKARVVFGRAL